MHSSAGKARGGVERQDPGDDRRDGSEVVMSGRSISPQDGDSAGQGQTSCDEFPNSRSLNNREIGNKCAGALLPTGEGW